MKEWLLSKAAFLYFVFGIADWAYWIAYTIKLEDSDAVVSALLLGWLTVFSWPVHVLTELWLLVL